MLSLCSFLDRKQRLVKEYLLKTEANPSFQLPQRVTLQVYVCMYNNIRTFLKSFSHNFVSLPNFRLKWTVYFLKSIWEKTNKQTTKNSRKKKDKFVFSWSSSVCSPYLWSLLSIRSHVYFRSPFTLVPISPLVALCA